MSFIDDIINRSATGALREEEINKELIYSNDRNVAEILIDSTYKGVRYFVVNRGIHPCCYVQCSEEFITKHRREEYDELEGVCVHGGVTWAGKTSELRGLGHLDGYSFGWDYGHCGDWSGYSREQVNLFEHNHKWTTKELIYACMDAIDQYLDQVAEDEDVDGRLKVVEDGIQHCETILTSETFKTGLEIVKKEDVELYIQMLQEEIDRCKSNNRMI